MQLFGLNISRATQGHKPERRASLAAPTKWLLDTINALTGGAAAGVSVNETTALSLAAVQACVRVISESVATMPLRFYGTTADGNKFADNAHPLSYLINEPNEIQTRFEFISWIVSQLKMGGNGYAIINRDPMTARPASLTPIVHKRVKPEVKGGQLFYKIEGYEDPFPATEILHFKGLTNGDPLKGISPISLHAQSLGITLAAEKSTARFYGKNAALKWVVKWQGGPLDTEKRKDLKDSFNNVLEGADAVTVLPHGSDIQQLNLSPEEAQFLATRKYGTEDIARIFGVPAYMIGADSQGIKSSVEQQAQDFYTQTILPIVTMMEQEMKRKLLREDEKGAYYFKFVFNSLLRADAKSRAEFYNMGIRGGWLTPNEARGLEDFNPMQGGETSYTESNLVPSDMMRDWIQSKIDAAPTAAAQTNNPNGNN